MNRVFRWLENVPAPLFVGVFWAVGCLWNLIFNMLVQLSGIQLDILHNFEPPQSIFDYVVFILIAPLVETALFQALPYYLLSKIEFFRKRIWLIIIVSGLVFASLHFYSIIYVVFAFFPGILLATGYHLRQGNHPFASIFAVHLFINATPLVYELLFS
ncbi:CPBP family glutamic-type intramembrane protease [Porphyromonadaceae bacterium W3.11]|nr:CPBP family glutamic-type intramembrane protease [Porphyromonadaceae bacterium W3.11]